MRPVRDERNPPSERESLSRRDADELFRASRQGVIDQLRRVLGVAPSKSKDRSRLLDIPEER
jgi:hypothetical protein